MKARVGLVLALSMLLAACGGNGEGLSNVVSGSPTSPHVGYIAMTSESKSACMGSHLFISVDQQTIHIHQQDKLIALLVTYGWYKNRCIGLGHAVNATWKSSGGHLSSTYGIMTYFWANRTGSYKVSIHYNGRSTSTAITVD